MHVDHVNACSDRGRHHRDLIVKRALEALGDPKRAERVAQCLCLVCFYIDRSRIAGQAFTEWTCLMCKENQPSWPNTAVPRLCKGCADGYGLCAECGADQELRPRRKLTRIKKAARPRPVPPIGGDDHG